MAHRSPLARLRCKRCGHLRVLTVAGPARVCVGCWIDAGRAPATPAAAVRLVADEQPVGARRAA